MYYHGLDMGNPNEKGGKMHCERFKCYLSEAACIKRQESPSDMGCGGCEKGTEILNKNKGGEMDNEKQAQLYKTMQDAVNEIDKAIDKKLDTNKIVVDFKDFPETLVKLKEYAKDQIRTPEGQALYMIRESIKNRLYEDEVYD